MVRKPARGEVRRGFQGAGLFEEVRGSGHDGQLALAMETGQSIPVQVEHHVVPAPHDEQGRRAHPVEHGSGEVGPPAPRDNGRRVGTGLRGGPERRARGVLAPK